MPAKLAALLLVLLALPTSAGAATPTNDIGRIAFTSDRDGNNEIYSARVDGDGQVNLTSNPATDQSPAVSADGAKVAFVSDRDGRMDVWVMNADGSDQHQVTTGSSSSGDADPAWSPDGASIAFASSRPFGDEWHVWVVDLATGALRRLTPGWGTSPSWSPDGSRLVYDGGGTIHLIDASGSGDTQITPSGLPPAGSPVWTPWGGNIVFGRYDDDWQTTNVRQLYIMPWYGGEAIPVTSGPYYHDHASFSPDWSWMIFQRQDGVFGSPELYYMRLSDGAVAPSVAGPGRNFVPSWGPTYVPPAPPPPPPPPADTTPPRIEIVRPTTHTDRIDAYTVDQVVLADYSCSDAGSGVRHCMGPVASGQPIDTSTVGKFEFRVFAADNAGNPVYRSAWYRVVYPFTGFFAPVTGDVTDVKAGDGAPLKFSLGRDYGLDVVTDATATPIDCASGEANGGTSVAGGPFTYNTSLDRYMKVWATDKWMAGSCYEVALTLRDGTRHAARFRLLK